MGFEQMARWNYLYSEIETHPAWKDYQHRLLQLRRGTTSSILQGTLDKHGKSHDNELRAVLHALDTLLSYVPAMKRDFEEMQRKAEEMKNKAKKRF